MADCKKYNGSAWVYSLRKLTTATDTITTLPAVLYPTGTTATVGLKGNTVQNGTPTPDNPIMPEGTGERTTNLVEAQILDANISANGKIIIFPQQNTYNLCIAKVEEGKTYCFYNRTGPYGLYVNYPTINSSSFDGTRHFESTITIPNGVNYIAARADYGANIMVVKGTTPPTSYEPYGYKIPILSNSTITPVYLGEVQTTRRVRKLVLTGEETWVKSLTIDGGFYCLWNNLGGIQYYQFYCDRCEYVDDIDYYVYGTCFSDTALNLWIGNAGWTVNNFKSYLAQQYANGTPVTVWYVLATETTGIVNEPLMKIGDYADEVSDITIPVTAGGDTLSVNTTVQPSEVSLSYTGWHTGAVHERENGAWTE